MWRADFRRRNGLLAWVPDTCSLPMLQCSTWTSMASPWAQRSILIPVESIKISASARLNPDFGQLDRLELIVHGEIVKTATAKAAEERLELNYEFAAKESCWLAVRAYGKRQAVAHTAPVYVFVDGSRRFWKTKRVPVLVHKYKNLVHELIDSTPLLAEDNEQWEHRRFVGTEMAPTVAGIEAKGRGSVVQVRCDAERSNQTRPMIAEKGDGKTNVIRQQQ